MKYLTVRQAAKLDNVPSEHFLRSLIKAQQCPGVYIGTRFYVDVDKLSEKLGKMSEENAEVQSVRWDNK